MTKDVQDEPRDRIEKWNARYSRGEGLYDFEPSPPLPMVPGLAKPGRALDLACGAGRHAIYLAGLGWHVDAVDASRAGLKLLSDRARELGVASRIACIQADLESPAAEFAIEPGAYDLICDFYFLVRALFPAIREGVRPGGLYAGAIHISDPAAACSAHHSFLLEPGELVRLVEAWGWEIVFSDEGPTGESGHSRATSTIIARRPVS